MISLETWSNAWTTKQDLRDQTVSTASNPGLQKSIFSARNFSQSGERFAFRGHSSLLVNAPELFP